MANSAVFAGVSIVAAAALAMRKRLRTQLREDATAFGRGVPKAELHLHIEGTFEPELMFKIAARNGLESGYSSLAEAHAARNFGDLQSFLDIYYAACAVLIHEQDFFDLAWAYFQRAAADGVRHVEYFFDPQTHTDRGIAFETVYNGLTRAAQKAEADLGVSSHMIMCFLRHQTEEQAFATLKEATPFLSGIAGVGLDSGEAGNPPEKFARVFAKARELGLRAVAHAGEEGPASYITDALDILHVERVDHGVRCLEDDAVVARLAKEGVPLTVCPLSNHCLQVYSRYFHGENVVARLMRRGVTVTLNSDDPAYFGGYIGDNYACCVTELGLTKTQVADLARNSFRATFLGDEAKARLVAEVDAYAKSH